MGREHSSAGLTRRQFLAGLGASAMAAGGASAASADDAERTNVLLITADDMDYGSLGVTGCRIPGITQHLDALAAQGMRFEHAHVTSAICQPCRESLMTGRFPHRNGGMGFEPIRTDVPTLNESLHSAGYLTGILAKQGHLAPPEKFEWDLSVGGEGLGAGRDPAMFYEQSKAFFEKARVEKKPFFLMANCQDPHRPFPEEDGEERPGFPRCGRYYEPEEADVPAFLPGNVPDVRREVAQYFSGVHRCDETVGELLRALEESGFGGRTIVMFLSDNGMAFPFAKTNCWQASTRTPLMVRWPGKIKPGAVNRESMISGVDIMPTVVDVLGLKPVEGMDGRSFGSLLRGAKGRGRDKVFTFITSTSGRGQFPMRSVRTRDFSYIFNGWSNGETVFKNESQSGLTFKAMQAAAETDDRLAERVRFFQYRVPEEFYDLRSDPFELENLIDSPEHQRRIAELRSALLEMMTSTSDPVLEAFRKRLANA